jgi:hypothetical protein
MWKIDVVLWLVLIGIGFSVVLFVMGFVALWISELIINYKRGNSNYK